MPVSSTKLEVPLGFAGKRILVTGHTGFKGSWLCEWLLGLGAEVHGIALDPQDDQPLFDQLKLSPRLTSDHRIDLRDRAAIREAIQAIRPDFIFHLAAQPLVRLSYDIPVDTFAVNALGTAHLLDALREFTEPCVVICVTTDKCYENKEWLYGYREVDAMGGYDPYSASKGCAELVIASYRRSFFGSEHSVTVASARAGNVIGGGDWALDRIVPDCFRALERGEPIQVRNKTATRPWQHVLEPLSGYLNLALTLAAGPELELRHPLTAGMNFGPTLASNRTVAQLVEALLQHAPGSWEDQSDPMARHEASKLNLAIDKAFHLLGWQPVWNFSDTISHTASWYTDQAKGQNASQLCQIQIAEYTAAARVAEVPWANS